MHVQIKQAFFVHLQDLIPTLAGVFCIITAYFIPAKVGNS